MKTLQYMRADERGEAGGVITPDSLTGAWLNTNSATQGIIQAFLKIQGKEVKLRILAAGEPEPRDWGETSSSIFAANTSSSEAMAFSAFYDFGFMETHLQAHIRQGVLIIAKFDSFKDNSGRSNYFSKEFFHRSAK